MSVDTTRPTSRRALLGATLGGLAATIAGALARPDMARATNGDTVKVGALHTGTAPTGFKNSTGDALIAENTATSASGLFALASAGTGTTYGVFARSNSTGGTGVAGVDYATTGATRGVYGQVASTQGKAVFGLNTASSGQATGVYGESAGIGFGVFGKNTGSGTGVRGEANAPGARGVTGYNLAGSGDGVGVEGYVESPDGAAVEGFNGVGVAMKGTSSSSTQPAILGFGRAGTGVYGHSAPAGTTPPTPPLKTGVYGYAAQDSAARAVYGRTTVGEGVRGQASTGIGVRAVTSTGVALRVDGRAVFSRAGRTNVAANASYVDVTVGGGLSSTAVVLATLQVSRAGVWIAAVRTNYPSSGKARIYLNKVASTSTTTPVGWFVVG